MPTTPDENRRACLNCKNYLWGNDFCELAEKFVSPYGEYDCFSASETYVDPDLEEAA